MDKVNTQKDYDEIDIISYLSTLKRNARSILFIAIALAFVTFLASFTFIPTSYQGELLVLMGNTGGNLFETADQATDTVLSLDNNVTVSQEKGRGKITISIKDISKDKIEKRIKTLAGGIKLYYTKIIENSTARFNARLVFSTEQLKNTVLRLNALQEKINRLNPFDNAQAISIQTYIQSYDRALERKFSLEDELQKMGNDPASYSQTIVKENNIETISPFPKIFLSASIAFILGLIIAFFYVLIKEWWEINKHLIR